MYRAYRREGEFDRAGRFESIDNPFTLGPMMKFVRRFGGVKKTDDHP